MAVQARLWEVLCWAQVVAEKVKLLPAHGYDLQVTGAQGLFLQLAAESMLPWLSLTKPKG